MENKEIGEGMLKVSNIAVSLDEKDYAKVIANTLNIRKSQVKNVKIAKKAVDARRKNKVHFNMGFTFEYVDENEFRKKERAVKKYNMLAYKKLVFDFYPSFRDGDFKGIIVSKNTKDMITKYELKLPTDRMFAKVHGDVVLHYTVYENQKLVMLDTLTPEDILTEGHQKELSTYKGVMVSKSHAERDMFKINLLNMLDNK